MFKRTIAKEVICVGKCPFNGFCSTVRLCPSEKCNSGIRFIRDDLKEQIKEKSIIISNKDSCFDCSRLNTTISNKYCKVVTVEHILSALWAFRITDIDIHVDCDEIPMMDGSANYWVKAIKSAGIKNFNEEIKYKHITEEIKYEEDDRYIIAKPCNRLKINYTIDFLEPSIGKNTFTYDESINSYEKDISFARTFCTESQVQRHKEIKKYFNNYDMLIFGENEVRISNDTAKLRYSNEVTRHKVLDLIGDLMSTGDFFNIEFICYKSGHAINRKIIDLIYKKILAN